MKRCHIIGLLAAAVMVALAFSAYAETYGVRHRRPKPHEFGNVTMNNHSEKNNVAPVVFSHWLHRSKYTCRLCHVDIGFAMTEGATLGTCSDNKNGFYCGACHNGKEAFAPIEKRVVGGEVKNCDRCHSLGKKVEFENEFYKFRKDLPSERFGNGIDWLKTEEQKLVKLKDYLEGVSFKRKRLEEREEFSIKTNEMRIPEIIFSHKKHTVWSGCELCHPEIFGIKKGRNDYTMQQIFNGKYCGACHGIVAFTTLDCRRCHTKEVY